MEKKRLVIVAGPNGSGKSTLADFLLRGESVLPFLNADLIAVGLGAVGGASLDEISAGKVLLQRLHYEIGRGADVAFETTMAGRSWTHFISLAKDKGYEVVICFVVVQNVELALRRIAKRVSEGGHNVPEEVVRRRFKRSTELFWSHYRWLCDKWYVFDNSRDEARLIASKKNGEPELLDRALCEGIFVNGKK